MKKKILWVLLLLVLCFCGYVVWNWTFIYRVATYPTKAPITSSDWFSPMAAVAGAKKPSVLQSFSEKDNPITKSARDKAIQYAEKLGSSAFLALHKGKIVAEKYWGRGGGRAITQSMSMHKTVVAVLVGLALQEKVLKSVHDPVSKYIQAWKHDARRSITIHHLLRMESGLVNDNNTKNIFSDLVQLVLGTDSNGTMLSIPSKVAPGTEFEYNNANTQMLGYLLEKAWKMPYPKILSEKLWKPLQAGDAKLWLDRKGGSARGFCCFFTTARNWARFGQLFIDEGKVAGKQVVPTAWLKEMVKPSKFEPDYGYQIWLGFSEKGRKRYRRSEPFAALDTVYLSGKHRQLVYIIPSKQMVVIRIGEKPKEWDAAVLPNTLVRGLKPSPKSAPAPKKPATR